ncbi:hypothetical protein NQ317_002513 [Molorchus minor]|uniref:Glucosylceramidase n=1 Tax=Molorchus minor TaxID=1323400 RepID=A0ABQ9J9N4_9CUCU|nr:hypothetical protein NQ317_002513 [Molorchus minor]
MTVALILYLLSVVILNVNANKCNTREVEFGIVCVCNSTYCDDVPELEDLSSGSFQFYTTSESQLGFNSGTGSFSSVEPSVSTVVIGETRYQTIIGFGGAFTDATGINIKSLSEGTQENLLDSYFGRNGIEYNLCRVPIGGTDFSPRPYTYDDIDGEDVSLEHFELQEEDLTYKIPFIQAALNRTPTLQLFGSAWSSPLWMKDYKVWAGYSFLKEEYYQAWAEYTVKFFDEYKKHDIEFWGMTTGNEPLNGFFPHEISKINSLGWIPYLQSKWIKENLGPTLRNSSYENVKIMIHDDSRLTFAQVVPVMLSDEGALEYIDGVAAHWYRDDQVPIEAFDMAKSDKKRSLPIGNRIMYVCIFKQGLALGSWERGTRYIDSIIEYLEHDCVGWVDWNMVLNMTGGPTYVGKESDGAILINAEADEFYKQPIFYAMGHFSKFVTPDSVRVEVSVNTNEVDDLRSVAFLRPDDLVAVIFYNEGSDNVTVQIKNGDDLYSEPISFVGNSITTVLFPINDLSNRSRISENQGLNDPMQVEFGIVCVCNSTYCDDVPELEKLPFGSYQLYTTSESQLGLNSRTGSFSSVQQSSVSTVAIGKRRFQTIIGFGGAFTDATGINIRSLPEGAQDNLLNSYFGRNGIEYSLCRVPLGGSDFSPRGYSYDDVENEDFDLEQFALQEEDFNYKIPIIHEALNRTPSLKLFASAWSAPRWMKTHRIWTGYSLLRDDCLQVWADYAVKFFDEYRNNNIEFWGMTTGNEPMGGFYSPSYFGNIAMAFVPITQARWIKENLGPTLRNRSHENVKIMIHDDSRTTIPHVVPLILNDDECLEYVDGVATHWYEDDEVPAEVLDLTRSNKKDVFLLSTEACTQGIELGSWARATEYIGSIIEYLQHGSAGWIDWNMALNMTGGPTFIGYVSDAPILVNASAQEFYKQPLFYAMGHFSKFIPPGSIRLDVALSIKEVEDLEFVAFLRPDDLVAVILFNNGTTSATVQIDNKGLSSDPIELARKSLTTVLFSTEDSSKKS